ncbi:lysine 2,3-aminomutase [Actinokineospora baliensis]|uniref:KamA family radical SAM protein n=1 Tax=Actinokineospora baliensis TaxID=547056 RepID=UPI001958741F|nr:lysine 2,3-aminomutase [Actinokineospora baliensis]MBM7774769.1 lysine 2,3-aminomutase [Actinokineospora baliensis]
MVYTYLQQDLVEPDWRRFPGWRDITAEQWRDVQWQRSHCVKTPRQLREVTGDLVGDGFFDDVVLDQSTSATMSMLLTPQLVNTMVPHGPPDEDGLRADPVRRYLLPIASDRRVDWPSHPHASRDSLHEAEMWATEGLTHRYPTKVLAEVVSTCPQYCGHCTRMDLVGPSTPGVDKLRFALRPADRLDRILAYLRATPGVRDVVVSGGDVANLPWPRLEEFVTHLLTIESIRDIRLASKALVGLPQHWLVPSTVAGIERVCRIAAQRGVNIALHTHANAACQVTPLVGEAARTLLGAGLRDVRNQGVLLAGVNDSQRALLDLCFALLDGASITPYYFYMCDLIPQAEHWRLPLHQAQALQDSLMGYLPGFATPRLVCDVPYAGKRWVHQVVSYDRVRGISTWANDFKGPFDPVETAGRRYEYVDPIHSLPEEGQRWWAEQARRHPDLALIGER